MSNCTLLVRLRVDPVSVLLDKFAKGFLSIPIRHFPDSDNPITYFFITKPFRSGPFFGLTKPFSPSRRLWSSLARLDPLYIFGNNNDFPQRLSEGFVVLHKVSGANLVYYLYILCVFFLEALFQDLEARRIPMRLGR